MRKTMTMIAATLLLAACGSSVEWIEPDPVVPDDARPRDLPPPATQCDTPPAPRCKPKE